jgi:hypothetical protein
MENNHISHQPDGALSFKVKDCTIITRMGGVDPAITLRELRERVKICTIDSIYHHFCELVMRPTFDDPEFRNDFAVWASRNLRDRTLAERLGVLNPYSFSDFEALRERLIEIIDIRLTEIHFIPSVPLDEAFMFLRSATAIFDTGMELTSTQDFIECLPSLSRNSIFYHFIDARRRTPEKIDDFTFWLQMMPEPPEELLWALRHIDFYYMSLSELKETLVQSTCNLSVGE